MSNNPDRRKPIILLCGLAVAMLSFLAPGEAKAGGGGCVEPFVDHCISTTANCVDCERFCRVMFPEENCTVEWAHCDEDEEYCGNPNYPVLDSCACKAGFGGGS